MHLHYYIHLLAPYLSLSLCESVDVDTQSNAQRHHGMEWNKTQSGRFIKSIAVIQFVSFCFVWCVCGYVFVARKTSISIERFDFCVYSFVEQRVMPLCTMLDVQISRPFRHTQKKIHTFCTHYSAEKLLKKRSDRTQWAHTIRTRVSSAPKRRKNWKKPKKTKTHETKLNGTALNLLLYVIFQPPNPKPWNWNWWNSCFLWIALFTVVPYANVPIPAFCTPHTYSTSNIYYEYDSISICFHLSFAILLLTFTVNVCWLFFRHNSSYYYCRLSFILLISTSIYIYICFFLFICRFQFVALVLSSSSFYIIHIIHFFNNKKNCSVCSVINVGPYLSPNANGTIEISLDIPSFKYHVSSNAQCHIHYCLFLLI